jgi:hypothetical protein
MLATLTSRVNIVLTAVWALLATVATLASRPRPLIGVVTGVLIGLTVGYLQSKSIGEAPDRFQTATSATEVRRVFLSTASGKRAILIQWTGAAVLLIIAVRQGNPLGGFVAGYASLMCSRELATLRAVAHLNKTLP